MHPREGNPPEAPLELALSWQQCRSSVNVVGRSIAEEAWRRLLEYRNARHGWDAQVRLAMVKQVEPSGTGRPSETGIGGQNVPNAKGGSPRRLGLLTPKLTIFSGISVERGQFQEPLEIQNFYPPPLIFGDLTPPIPVSKAQYHCTQNDCRTELHYFRIIFGNACSDYRTELFHELLGLGKKCEHYRDAYRIILGIMLGNFGGGIPEPKLFWN